MKLNIPTPTLRRIFALQISNRLSNPSFLTVHHLYFLSTILVCSIIFWLLSLPQEKIPFIDSLFLVVSALTSTGLTTRNLSTLNTAQQILIWILIAIGSPTFISLSVVWIRKRAFESQFAHVVRGKKETQSSLNSNRSKDSILSFHGVPYPTPSLQTQSLHSLNQNPPEPVSTSRHDSCVGENAGEHNGGTNGSYFSQNGMVLTPPESHKDTPTLKSKASTTSFLASVRHFGNAMVGRNSQFYGLTRQEREELGCIEYKALKLLSFMIPAYLLAFQAFGSIALASFIAVHRADTAYENGIKPWWLGVFDGVSAFNNAGMSLLDQNMIPFGRSYFVLLTTAFLTLAGNTAYPIFLRLILWTLLHITPKTGRFAESRDIMAFILKYPRRVYTHLFPSTPTWYLLLVLLMLNGIDFVAFEVLNRSNPVFDSLSVAHRTLDGLVQTIFIRSAGFTVISISSLRIGLQALYVPMMYISAFPVAITMRSSNVYEERSLGIYASELTQSQIPEARENASLFSRGSRTRLYFLRQQLSHQLSHDFWFVVICTIAIIWIETGSYDRDPLTFSVFNILFEVISAYACVGLSIGLPDQNYALCGAFHISSKVMLCFLMFRGRHRDLPVAIDRAVQLPSNILGATDDEDNGNREI